MEKFENKGSLPQSRPPQPKVPQGGNQGKQQGGGQPQQPQGLNQGQQQQPQKPRQQQQ